MEHLRLELGSIGKSKQQKPSAYIQFYNHCLRLKPEQETHQSVIMYVKASRNAQNGLFSTLH